MTLQIRSAALSTLRITSTTPTIRFRIVGGVRGATGASYAASSTTSLAIGTGSKTFTTQSGLAYQVGTRVRAASFVTPTTWMEGVVTSYSGTTLVATMDLISGSGTIADWRLSLAGESGSVADDAVTNAKLADMAQATFKGRASGAGTGNPVDLTATEALTILLAVDGAGSGLDADLLDGNSAAFFATATGLSDHLADTADAHAASAITNTPAGNIAATTVQAAIAELDSEKLAATSYTAADVLTKLLTVDGAGSGLDADLLDGNSSAFFSPASVSGTAAAILASLLTVDGVASGLDADLLDGNSSAFFSPASVSGTAAAVLASLLTVDGSGSGLDADLLDGSSSAAFGLVANPLSQFAATTSLQLKNTISDETGSGALVFGTSPTFTTDLTSPLIIGGTGTGSSLTLKSTSGVGATDFINFLVGSNGAVESARILSSGIMIKGGTADYSGDAIQVQGATGVTSAIFNGRWSATATGPQTTFFKSRNAAIGSRTIVQSGDTIGRLRWQADDGAADQLAAYIEGTVDGTPGAGDMPGRLGFFTTPDGAITPTERLRIDNVGNIVPGTAALATGATAGFTYIQTCAGTPTGTPTTHTGRCAMIFDTTNKKLYFYNGAWQKAQVTAVDAIYA